MIDEPSPNSAPPRSATRIGAVSRPAATRLVAVVLVAVALVATACGGVDSEATPDTVAISLPGVADVGAAENGDEATATELDCPTPTGSLDQFGATVITSQVDRSEIEVCVLVADTFALRQRGLMEVTDLGPYAGMLFAYAEPSTGGYWMRNTPMPLSISWVSSSGEVVGTADMEPCLDPDPDADCPSSDPGESYQWAVEVPKGGLGTVGLTDGASVVVAGWPIGRE